MTNSEKIHNRPHKNIVKRIDLFMPTSSQYGALHHFTKKLWEALNRIGLHSRLLTIDKSNPGPFIKELLNDPPEFTLAFNGALPDSEGRFLCDLLKIPHVAYLVDSPFRFLSLIKSPFNIISCIDQFFCDEFKDMGYDNALFMPLAVEKEISFNSNEERIYDILLLASYLDHEKVAQIWRDRYPPSVQRALFEAAEISLSETLPYNQILDQYITKANDRVQFPKKRDIQENFEIYIRGLERVRLVTSIKNARIHIFGNGNTQEIWDHHLGKNHNVVVHPGVPFTETFELMKRAKIVLNSCAWVKNGAHDRVFTGFACGAVVLTHENPYLKNYFTEGQSILFFRGNAMNAIEDNIKNALSDESKRQAMAKKGRDITMLHHTWDQRAASLISHLNKSLSI